MRDVETVPKLRIRYPNLFTMPQEVALLKVVQERNIESLSVLIDQIMSNEGKLADLKIGAQRGGEVRYKTMNLAQEPSWRKKFTILVIIQDIIHNYFPASHEIMEWILAEIDQLQTIDQQDTWVAGDMFFLIRDLCKESPSLTKAGLLKLFSRAADVTSIHIKEKRMALVSAFFTRYPDYRDIGKYGFILEKVFLDFKGTSMNMPVSSSRITSFEQVVSPLDNSK
jgi:hypothetical protein